MPKQQSLYDYEDRYKRVYAAGGLNWNNPTPNPALSRLLDSLPGRSNCVEFGCGEGYQAHFMASRGHLVTAIDLSPSAIAMAIRQTMKDYPVTFLAGDVTDAASLHLPPATYDLAVDIGCLHMMTEDEDRTGYLELVRSVLKPGGRFFLQEGLRNGDIEPKPEKSGKHEAGSLEPSAGDLPRTIITADGVREILLPLLSALMLNLEG